MRFFVIILVIINIGVWAYFNQNAFYDTPPTQRNEEIIPEKMHLLTPHQLSKLPEVSSASTTTPQDDNVQVNVVSSTNAQTETNNPVKKTPETNKTASSVMQCFTWGVFSSGNISKANNAIAKLALKSKVTEHSSTKSKRYWVYLPPLKSAAAAQQKAAELKLLGIEELFVLQGERSKNAISFGVFEDKQLANNLLESLKAKGIRNVVQSLRSPGNGSYSIAISNVSNTKLTKLKSVKSKFPETKLKKTRC